TMRRMRSSIASSTSSHAAQARMAAGSSASIVSPGGGAGGFFSMTGIGHASLQYSRCTKSGVPRLRGTTRRKNARPEGPAFRITFAWRQGVGESVAALGASTPVGLPAGFYVLGAALARRAIGKTGQAVPGRVTRIGRKLQFALGLRPVLGILAVGLAF